jgi:hypothetical protein
MILNERGVSPFSDMKIYRKNRIQESGVAGVQELENPGAWRRFSQ